MNVANAVYVGCAGCVKIASNDDFAASGLSASMHQIVENVAKRQTEMKLNSK